MSRLRASVLLLPLLTGVVLAQPGDDAGFKRFKAEVERARGLAFKHSVKTVVMTPAAYQKFVRAQYAKDDAEDDAGGDAAADDTEAAWKALGLIPRSLDLDEEEEDEEKKGTDGLYVSDDKTPPFKKGTLIVVRQPGEDTTEVSVHELLHALHDQHFNLSKIEGTLPRSPSGAIVFDRQNAADSLEEGAATLIGEEIAKRLGRPVDSGRGGPFEPDRWIDAKAEFAYSAGSAFAKAVRAHGGNKRLNAAYVKPPTSTEQILHPERYLRATPDLPSTVKIADMTRALKGKWKTVDTNTLGEFGVGWLTSPEAGSGWDGDQYQVIQNRRTRQTIANWQTTWDSPQDAAEFRTAAATSDAVKALKRGDLLVLRQQGTGVFMASGVKPHQVKALLKRAEASSVIKLNGDDDGWPDRKPPSSSLDRLLQSAVSGTTLVRRGRRPVRVGTYVLSPAGQRLAQDALTELAQRARKGEGGVKDLGGARFALRGSRTLHYEGGVLTYTVGSAKSVRRLSKILAGLGESTTTPRTSQGAPRQGAAKALGRGFR